jgi:hypothetical protein
MDEDREGVRADSQHENVLMEMELAAGAGNQASELPYIASSSDLEARGLPEGLPPWSSPAPVLPFLASHRRSYLRPVVDRSCVRGHGLGRTI